MSLHGKVVAWFAFFASVIVTLFVLGDYYQSTRALRVALEARAQALASQAATDLERRYEHASAELKDFGREVAQGGHAGTDANLDSYAAVRVFRDTSLVLETAGARPNRDSYQCVSGDVPFLVEFSDAAGQHYRVEATMSAAEFISPISGVTARLGGTAITAVMTTAGGALISDAGCVMRSKGNVPASLEHRLSEQVKAAADGHNVVRTSEVRPSDADALFLVAIAPARHPAWSVAVALDYDQWAAPFVAARTKYLGIMIAFMLAVLLFTLRMIQVDMRRLSAIARAADSIGHGHFDVWLPPPTGDEVGRLSLALGKMVNRLGSTMRQAELNAAMAAVGELATFLSHEIRNPLSALRLNLQMLRRDIQRGVVTDDEEELVDICLAEMQRLDDVVKTVLDLGRKGHTRIGVCDAHDTIEDTVRLMRSKFSAHGVVIETRLGAADSEVGIDGAKLKSVLINLLLNSIDAMASSSAKRITITSELHDLLDGTQFELRVTDTGPGVPPELETRIFEPFFTTKANGSGVGLATAQRIVKECGGVLRCNPAFENKIGGEFVMELPLAHPTQEVREPAMAAAG